mgnify:FL=1
MIADRTLRAIEALRDMPPYPTEVWEEYIAPWEEYIVPLATRIGVRWHGMNPLVLDGKRTDWLRTHTSDIGALGLAIVEQVTKLYGECWDVMAFFSEATEGEE